MQRRRATELLECLDLGRNQAESRTDRFPLEIDVHTEAGEAGDRVGEIELALDLEVLLLLAREDAVEEVLRLLLREGGVLGHARDFSTHANDRGRPNGHMEV